MPSTIPLPPKKDVALALLENSSVFVHLDPRNDQVRVPPWYKKQPRLVLQIGLNMPVPIPDLNLDDDSVSCTLSFNRSPHFCRIPWSSVFALVGEDGRGMVWPEDIPPEVAAEMQSAQQKQQAKSHLRAVEEPKAAAKPAREPDRARQKRAKKKAARAADAEKAPRPKRPVAPAPLSAPPATRSDDAAEPPTGGKKPKRELPPYLRVVK